MPKNKDMSLKQRAMLNAYLQDKHVRDMPKLPGRLPALQVEIPARDLSDSVTPRGGVWLTTP